MTDTNVQAMQLPVEKLRPFEGHPFKVTDDAEMDQLIQSIRTQGLLTPIAVRPIENNEYEVISGHRRLHACKKAGIETVPALIYALNRDEATIMIMAALRSMSWTMTGIVSRPASSQACFRLCPAISSYPPSSRGRAIAGTRAPYSRMLSTVCAIASCFHRCLSRFQL